MAKSAPKFPIVKKPTLSRPDIADAVASKLRLSQNKARKLVDVVLAVVKEKVKLGHKVELRGFVVLQVKNVKARVGRNPATGEKVDVAAKQKVVAKASPHFLGAGRQGRKGQGSGAVAAGLGGAAKKAS